MISIFLPLPAGVLSSLRFAGASWVLAVEAGRNPRRAPMRDPMHGQSHRRQLLHYGGFTRGSGNGHAICAAGGMA